MSAQAMAAAVGGDELGEIQAELQVVKKALQRGEQHLGMSGETLQRYLLQLNEKENLVLSRQLRALAPPTGMELLSAAAPGASVVNGSGQTLSTAAAGGMASAPRESPTARELPSGPVKPLRADSLVSVLEHMQEYEASPQESAKALRALSSLAYRSAVEVGDQEAVFQQALRLLQIHPEEDAVQAAGMRALCNLAYDPSIALERIASAPALEAILKAMVKKPEVRDAQAKGSEAVARVVAAEVTALEQRAAGDPKAANVGDATRPGPLLAIFQVALSADGETQETVVKLVRQIISNEVVGVKLVGERFVATAAVAKEPMQATGWLELAKKLVPGIGLNPSPAEIPDLASALITAGAIREAVTLMQRQASHAPTQLSGIEAMSSLVGNRWPGLDSFAAAKGLLTIEEAMRAHVNEKLVQMKGMRALASGVQWPVDMQEKAGFSAPRAVDLTKAALAQLSEDDDVVLVGLEMLQKYLDKGKCVEEVKKDGGVGLVKAIMAKHNGKPKVLTSGAAILEACGDDRKWAPRGA